MFIGKKIKEARNEMNMTQKQLAKELIQKGKKASNTAIANWESGLNSPDIETLQEICNILKKDGNYFFELENNIKKSSFSFKELSEKQAFPLLGMVKAGYDYFASENIIGYVSIDKKIPDVENCYALQIVGDSMQPILYEDDIIIVHKQDDVESGQVAIILIDNEEATVKKVIKHEDYIELIAFNSYYPPKKLTKNDNFKIIGKVIEGRISKIFE